MKRKILVAGICGRMGGRVAELVAQDPELDLVGGVELAGHPRAGAILSVGETEVRVARGFADNVPQAELLADFTSPEGTVSAVEFCLQRSMALVAGTTGQSEANVKMMKDASKRIPLLFSPNMSVGVTLLTKVLPGIVRALEGKCEIEIVEKHHRAKKDSPSGTALKLAQAIVEASRQGAVGSREDGAASREGERFQIRYGRDQGVSERQRNEIFVHSIRAGDIVGEHTVLLALKGERIEIKHVAESRDCFAHGTLAAIKFLLGKKAGWYTMEDVIDLQEV
ncbi:MAG: 4-hydroxy-tetrahydrodipicolinate reductase [Candidatus Eisenbacteria bacterium]|nr:4-hydroxy-tetrahydrodipicolinate reductase [Candidatus Eisenbacteria bacterium]